MRINSISKTPTTIRRYLCSYIHSLRPMFRLQRTGVWSVQQGSTLDFDEGAAYTQLGTGLASWMVIPVRTNVLINRVMVNAFLRVAHVCTFHLIFAFSLASERSVYWLYNAGKGILVSKGRLPKLFEVILSFWIIHLLESMKTHDLDDIRSSRVKLTDC